MSETSLISMLQEPFLTVLNSIYNGILIIDKQEKVVFINSEYLRIVKLKSEEILNLSLRTVRPGAVLPAVMHSGKAQGGVYRQEKEISYVVDMSPIIKNDKIIGAISVVRDISEINKLTKALSASQQSAKNLRKSLQHIHKTRYNFEDIIGQSKLIQDIKLKSELMAKSDADILISGESGTGKEVFAQSIHNASSRNKSPFIALNCATLTSSMIESELFGYVDGAFTGAKSGGREGFFEVASGGTLFLDEIGELSLSGQAKLLRVLQERMVRRVGDTIEKPTNVKIIAATNRPLIQLVASGHFRADLYYRLNLLHLEIPPLRERQEDIAILIESFLQKISGDKKIKINQEVVNYLTKCDWAGNVRELHNTIEYAVHMAQGQNLELCHLPTYLYKTKEANVPNDYNGETLNKILAKAEETALRQAMKRYSNLKSNVEIKKQVAKELNISIASLYSKLKTFNIVHAEKHKTH